MININYTSIDLSQTERCYTRCPRVGPRYWALLEFGRSWIVNGFHMSSDEIP